MHERSFQSETKAFAPLLLMHALLTLSLMLAGKFNLLSAWITPQGYTYIASDSIDCHWKAIDLMHKLQHGQFGLWWIVDSRFHTRCASLCYWLWGNWTGLGVLSYWPVNITAFWTLWIVWRRLIMHLGGRTIHPSWGWLCLPTLMFHCTQLIRDPLYLAFGLIWLIACLDFIKSQDSRTSSKALLTVLICCPFLFWVRERFWILTQLTVLIWLFGFIFSACIKKSKWSTVCKIFLLCIFINISSIPKTLKRISFFEETVLSSEEKFHESAKLHFFSKIAGLRNEFIERYNQSSDLDQHIQFYSDSDVVRYIPRALQIANFMPFPSMWFQHEGKTGHVGRLISALEICFIWLILAILICTFPHWWKNPCYLMCIGLILVHYCALGCVIVNGGALYRMRYLCWLMIMAMGIAQHSNLRYFKIYNWFRVNFFLKKTAQSQS